MRALERLQSLKVMDLMARSVVQLRPEQSMSEAARVFQAHEISSAPVVDREGRCIGVLSAADYLKRERYGNVGQRSTEALVPDADVVGCCMSTAVQTIAPDASLLHAAQVMCAQHIHHLPVLDQSRVIGIISTMDIVAAVVNAMDEAAACRGESS